MRLYPPSGCYYEEEELDLICEMLDRGFPTEQIVTALMDELGKVSSKSATYYRQRCRDRIRLVAQDRWNWSHYLDPIGMELAFMGSKDEWQNLNYYERREVVLRLQLLLDNDTPHPAFPDRPINEGGLADWAEAVGCEDVQSITNPFGRRNRIRAALAEAKANTGVNA